MKHHEFIYNAQTPVGASKEPLGSYMRKNITRDADTGCETYRYRTARIRIDNREFSVPRIRYVLKYGTFPRNHVLVHKCNNKECVNPDHLEPVSRKELATRSAGMRGHKDRKVSKALAHEIKVALRNGATRQELSYQHRLTYGTIRNIDLGNHWTLRT